MYGETGKTYELEIRKPKVFPFVCHLNFTAPGGLYGDIIQVRNLYNGLHCERGNMLFWVTCEGCGWKGVGQRFWCYVIYDGFMFERWKGLSGTTQKGQFFLLIFVGSVVFLIKPAADIKLKIIIIIIADTI